ncbi:MAG TPA: hypothetical protein K8V08_11170 [Brevibacterium senegalense]|uniref:Uncharacterized protein n=1 Tax=Brevibacterium senegalense TaxID=1033736 RepID=A0A921MFE6_9MICO|nr:hypothetical protein [Brevibacterium senegalense]
MCRPVGCRICGKTTWAGCGQHVAQVKSTVPRAQWCGGNHSPAEVAEAKEARGGFVSRLFRRSPENPR